MIFIETIQLIKILIFLIQKKIFWIVLVLINLMGNSTWLFFLIHTSIFASIFWFLSIIGEYFFTKKVTSSKRQFYECGFKLINDISAQINFNFILFAVFLIIYDVEFIFIIPLIFNMIYLGPTSLFVVIYFFLFFIFSFIYDWQLKALNWHN